MTIILDGTTGITTPTTSTTGEFVTSVTGFKNRIINGAMVIDQRNAGASFTPTSTGSREYALDRWSTRQSQASKFSIQQSSTAPTGFINSTLITSLSAYSITSSDQFTFVQILEGLNISDWAWGTASATTVTMSFWVRSSLTGTFGGAIRNDSANRSYPFSYTISVADTFEKKTITINGDTSGTWLTTNGVGLSVSFGLGVGSTLSGTAGAWAAANYASATGATSVVGTNGATFYITGVQLEKGSTATSFDYRPYGTELLLCERYYQIIDGFAGIGNSGGTTVSAVAIFPVTMRTSPSIGTTAALRITDPSVADFSQSSGNASIASSRVSSSGIQATLGNFTGITQRYGYQHNIGSNSITLSSEL